MLTYEVRPIHGVKDRPFLWDMLYEMIHIPKDKPPKELLLRLPEIRKYLEGWGRAGTAASSPRRREARPLGPPGTG
ncbi:hypothetical protein LJK88_45185 [Paenibacillus sp. P26]|nr:hypothetical protein LJK88_45185 [Paenibacillus sp. P26]UUZ92157.1 hypothetical protein LJK87_43185 [Paenibacillus sp. P25]